MQTSLQATTFTEAVPRLSRATSRLPSLDGWRAVSILMVLGNHNTFVPGCPFARSPLFNSVFDGNLGVRFFFIISGFLITWLMVLEKDKSGSVNLREFYTRRCLRILPIYCAYLFVLAVLHVSGLAQESASAWIGNLTFTRNMMGGTGGGDALSAQLWSLSVEEQFYVIWPALFFFLRRSEDRLILGVLAVPILMAPAIRGISYLWFYPGTFQYYHLLKPVFSLISLKYFDCLAFGCGSAVLFAHKREILEGHLTVRPFWTAGVGIAMICFPHLSALLPIRAVTVVEIGPTLQAFGFSILLLQSIVMPEWAFYQILNHSWVLRIGVWSYSIYIWQQLFWSPPSFLGLRQIWWAGIWILPLLAVTLISYYGLERPFFKLRSRYREVKLPIS